MWSRGACCIVAMLAVSCVQAMILYDEPAEDQEDVYQLENEIEEESAPSPRDLMDTNPELLYRLFGSPDHEKLFKFPYRSRWIHSDMGQNSNLYFPKRSDSLVQMNDKRDRKAPVIVKAPKSTQQKWKLKKGAHLICYLKLCTFRSYG